MANILVAAGIEIGKAIVEQILTHWVKNSVLAEGILSGLVELTGSKALDALDDFAKRKGKRQFEEIGDKITKRILPILKAENIKLDLDERKAIAKAVLSTLKNSHVTGELLLERNLQPAELEAYLLESNLDATSNFSFPGIILYQRLIKEASVYIVDISSQLPAFTEHTFGEILEREDLILYKVDRILNDLHKLREFLDPTNDRFEIEYREAVARNLDVLQLIGADVSLPNRRHKLSVAYITLSVSQKSGQLSLPSDQTNGDDAQNEVEDPIVSVDTALSSSNRLLIKGPAGSGKTTLLQWIAVKAATKSLEGALTNWNGYVPFYIRLRHYAQKELPRPEAFPEFAAPLIVGKMPARWVHTMLDAGRAIILIDGVDELSHTQRDNVYTWLKDLVETYKDCPFIVTSRPHAIEDGWMCHEAFKELILQEMSLSDIYSFIDHWHNAVKQELLTDAEKRELEPLANHLKLQIKQIRTLRTLATNPLLCAMLCALNRDRRRNLPVNRIEIYQSCCSLLLERRDKESQTDLTDYLALNYGQKLRILADLAYWMNRENLTEVEVGLVDARFSQKLMNMPNIALEATKKSARLFLVERSGIIREPVAGQIDFAHRTFQEFFAAQAAIDAMDIKYLVQHAHLDQWREVIIMAAGLAPQIQCEELINRLIERGEEEKEYRYQIHLLATACLETTIELKSETQKKLESRLSQLVPPKEMTDAKALAAAGEIAVKHLHKNTLEKKGKLSATICAACIYTLSLIGGEIALDTLESYATDTREGVLNELLKDWDMFDRKIYGQRILSQALKDKVSLRLSSEYTSSLEGLPYLSALTTLDLSSCSQLSDVSPLTNLPALTTLDLSSCSQLSDVSPLTNLSALTTLNLSGCDQLSNLSLTNLPVLTTLDLSSCSQLSYLNLTNLSALTTLNFSSCSQLSYLNLTNLSALYTIYLFSCSQLSYLSLVDLPALSTLDLSSCSQLSDLSLTNLPALSTLDLSSYSQLSDLRLVNLPALSTLDLSSYSQLSDLSSFANFPALSTLNLSSCDQITDLSPLANLPVLATLNLSGCSQITDLSPLANLPVLATLNLSGCSQITDPSPLANLLALSTLDLSSCSQITDLSFSNLPTLSALNLSGCYQLSDLRLANLPTLTTLDLSSCPQLSNLSLANLPTLTTLDLSSCSQLSDLRLANLPAFTTLDLSSYSQLSNLSLVNLSALSTLNLSSYSQLSNLSLANLPALTTLNLSGCSQIIDLSPLANLPALTTLNLSGCSQIIDLSPLTNLSALTTLNLSGCSQLSNLSPLANLPALTTLDLSGCSQLSNLSPLANLPTLATLDLSGCSQIIDLSPLANLSALSTLDLSGCSQIIDLSLLTNLSALSTLNLSSYSHLSNLSPLANLSALITLNPSSCSQISGISLADLPDLTTLDLSSYSQLSNLSLTNLSALTTLNLSSCSQLSDLNLVNLSALTTLNLSGCDQLSDLSSLTNLPALTTLNLSGCDQLSDLSPLANLPALSTLNLSSCSRLTNLNPLADLPALTTLNLFNCSQITNFSTLANLPALTTLNLSLCYQLTYLSPLANLRALTYLDLSYCFRISNLGSLANLPALSTLNIRNCPKITDLSLLSHLANLKIIRS